MKNSIVLIMALTCIILVRGSLCFAQDVQSKEERMEWWSNARFGMFIHFGVYAKWGGVYHGYQQAKGGAEWILNRAKIPVEEYVDSAKNFNPVHYDADQWVKMAKDAGMKYIIITAKHHDGFALFDTEASAWNIVDATKYGKDLLKPLAEACRKHGMKLGFYYSQAQDWVNPGGSAARRLSWEGWPNPDSTAVNAYTKEHQGHWDPIQETKSFEQYIDEVSVPQVRELLTNYGDIAVLWWDTPVNMTDEAATKLDAVLDLQPHIITNDRLKRPNFPGDTKSPEQKVPDQGELNAIYWETCMTMNGSWGYKSWDNKWKSTVALLRNLVDIASKGGNYLLNIGPKPDGTFPEESIARLREIGNWMNINGEAIYDTESSPIGESEDWRCTMKTENGKTTLYVALINRPEDDLILLPKLDYTISTVKVLGESETLRVTVEDGKTAIKVPEDYLQNPIPILKLMVNGLLKKGQSTHPKKAMDSGALDEKPI